MAWLKVKFARHRKYCTILLERSLSFLSSAKLFKIFGMRMMIPSKEVQCLYNIYKVIFTDHQTGFQDSARTNKLVTSSVRSLVET